MKVILVIVMWCIFIAEKENKLIRTTLLASDLSNKISDENEKKMNKDASNHLTKFDSGVLQIDKISKINT